jgi:hypothetical protein
MVRIRIAEFATRGSVVDRAPRQLPTRHRRLTALVAIAQVPTTPGVSSAGRLCRCGQPG